MVYDQTDQTEQDEVVQREGPDLVRGRSWSDRWWRGWGGSYIYPAWLRGRSC